MYERMLDKQQKPDIAAFVAYCGERGSLFTELDDRLVNALQAERLLRFPYGNAYGWGMKYSVKSKHICDVFAEKDAFCVMLRLTDKQFAQVYDGLADCTKACIDNKYPCGNGGWIHYRVLTRRHLEDIEKLLMAKVQNKAEHIDKKGERHG